MLAVMLLRMVMYAPIMAIGGIFKVLHTNVSMSWIIVLGVILIVMVVAVLFIVAIPKFKILQNLVDRLNLVTREILTGLPVIRAFSTEKHEENFAFTWVRFIRFSAEKESWLQPKARICAKGVLELSIYLDKINLSCRVEEMAEWVKPVMTNGTEDELPF